MSQGVQHIVISFPQVVTDNALNMVEIFNQLAGREIGYKNWAKWGMGDYTRYPTAGHPFADYWGIWVNTDCGEWELNYDTGTSEFTVGPSTNPNTLTGQTSGATGVLKWFTLDSGSWAGGDTAGTLTLKEVSGTFQSGEIITGSRDGSASANGVETQISKTECCFEMGGCGDPLMPYPPLRQTAITEKMSDLDPSLCFDMSEYGHLGYDPLVGAPDPDSPVQNQYTGTWEIYIPPNGDDRVGQLLANHVINAAVNPLVYITNGELEGIKVGGSVTWEAHVTGGGVLPYTYEWSIKEGADPGWSTVGGNSATWQWDPVSGDVGTYAVRCSVTDSRPVTPGTGEVTWEGFEVFCDQCDKIKTKYQTCLEIQSEGREVDYDVCKSYTGQTICESNGCTWYDGYCMLDICLTEVSFDGKVTAPDYTVFKREFGRSGCPCDPSGDLCQKYLDLYNCCVDMCEAERGLDYDVCKSYTGQTICESNGCTWYDGYCMLDICLTEVSFDGKVTAPDYTVFKREFSRSGCPSSNP